MQRNLMLDIETFGTQPGCVVLSIGAVEFDETGVTHEFHAHIDPGSAVAAGLTIDPNTVMWWLEQDKAAQTALLQAERHPLHDVIQAFIHTFEWDGLKIWANGASFDFPILKHAIEAAGFKQPWAYYNEMDYRTVKNLVPKNVFKLLKVEPTIAHDALDDARAQAQTLLGLLNHLTPPKVQRAAA